MIVLETQNVTKQFGGLTAVNEVSMKINQGDVVGLIGPNGAGKTTFINAISGLNPPTSGEVKMFGENTTGLTPEKIFFKTMFFGFTWWLPLKLGVFDE